MHGWIWLYKDRTPGCQAGIECTWLMGPRDVPQPDLFLRILPEYGGQSGSKGQYAEGAPELIVEISGCRASRDLGVKLELYRRAGVREYLTVQLSPRQIVWRRLARGRYQEIQPDADGLLKSVAFPGLWLDAGAVWSSKKSIRTALEKGLRSADHAGFVQRLVGNK
jgi:Uma2 family endonuclease